MEYILVLLIVALLNGAIAYIDGLMEGIIPLTLYAEQYMSTLAGVDLFQSLFDIVFGFGVSLIVLKFLKKGFETYVLWSDGDADEEPIAILTNFFKAMAVPYALTCPALTSRKMSLCRKMMRLMNPRQCNRKVLLRIPVTPLIPHLGSSLPLCRQRIPTPLQMALKQKSGGRIAARFVCGLGGSPFLYPLEPYR